MVIAATSVALTAEASAVTEAALAPPALCLRLAGTPSRRSHGGRSRARLPGPMPDRGQGQVVT